MSEPEGLEKYYNEIIKENHLIYVSEHYQIVLFIVMIQCLFYVNLGLNSGQ